MPPASSPKTVAGPPTYELHSLGWKAFQQLCLSVTAEVWGQTVQGFFDSHDGGRDGAFYGSWSPNKAEAFAGSFTVQCKFSQKPGRGLSIGSLSEELGKAARLAARGLADNYFLLTNMQLTGTADEAIRAAFEAIPGVTRCHIYGAEQISQFIRESPRLRMLVPRVYDRVPLLNVRNEAIDDKAVTVRGQREDENVVLREFPRAATDARLELAFEGTDDRE